MKTYIDKYSWKCLLGQQAKNITEQNEIYSWTVGKKQHFTTSRDLLLDDVEYLKSICPSNFHYLSEDNINFLRNHFKIDKGKNKSILLDINDLSLIGHEYKNLRHCLSKASKNNFVVEDNYRKLEDVKNLIEEWSNEYTDKYFRDNSGKNYHFYKNNFHLNCINAFIYHENMLIAFGTLSPNENGHCSYILGKALFKRFYGLSEWADMTLYKKANLAGINYVNMGQAKGGLLFYKKKFMKAVEQIHFDGSIG